MSQNPKELEESLDPRVRRTRNWILQAFDELLKEKGFESISVQDITERAQIHRGTFYTHFQDKYALLDYAVTYKFGHEIEKRTLNACHYTPENLRNLILAVCEYSARMHSECAQPHQQFESLVEGTIKQKLFELLSYWLEQSRPHTSVEVPATVASWAIYGLALLYSRKKRRPTLETFVEEALQLVAINLEQFAQSA